MDEAPLLVLTNYHVTVFLRRSQHVHDKRLWASEPVWFDRADLPVRACWAHALQQAQVLRGLKGSLPRALVPPTSGGHRIQDAHMPAQQPGAEQQAAAEQQGAGSAARRKRLRQSEQKAPEPRALARPMRQCAGRASSRPRARSPSGQGCEEGRRHLVAPQPAAASTPDADAGGTLELAELGLTAELLGAGPHGHTLKVRLPAPHPTGSCA